VTLALHQAGVRLLPGTDTPNPFVVPGVSLHEELAAMVAAGLPTMTVLAGATREAARALGRLGEQGTVEVGKRADLVLLDKDPRRDITATRRIGGVVTQGRWVPTTGQP